LYPKRQLKSGYRTIEERCYTGDCYTRTVPGVWDAAGINAKISDEKRELAFDFLNMITGKDLMVKASMNDGDPRYLLPARYSTYDALAQEYPIYVGLKEIATVPDACVFRIQPDGDAYIDEFAEKADLLPSLTK